MSKPTLKVTVDRTDEINEICKRFRRDSVLVGIPQQETKRDGPEPINNAALLAINEYGSPARNIPPRPVMKIGIRNAQKDIAEQFKLAMLGAFKTGISVLSTYYNRAGIIASTSVKKVINAQEGIAPPSPTTLAIRRAGGFHNWIGFGANLDPLSFRNKDVKDVGGFLGTKALIVTGQMRNAITYVVKGEE
jgi:hypothetical protein